MCGVLELMRVVGMSRHEQACQGPLASDPWEECSSTPPPPGEAKEQQSLPLVHVQMFTHLHKAFSSGILHPQNCSLIESVPTE